MSDTTVKSNKSDSFMIKLNKLLNNNDLSDNYKGDTEKLVEWDPKDIETLKSVSMEVPVTDKSILRLRYLAIVEFILYIIRLVILIGVYIGVILFSFSKLDRMLALFILIGLATCLPYAFKPSSLMRCPLSNALFYNSNTRGFICTFDSKYSNADNYRGVIVNQLFINLTHDSSYFDLNKEDTLILYINPDGKYLIQQAERVIRIKSKKV